jgi:hypothetical protein
MERIIRFYAVQTFNKLHNSKMRTNRSHLWNRTSAKKGSSDGGIEPSIKTDAEISATQQPRFSNVGNSSKSLQMLLDQRPSILAYLVLLTSTFFLATLIIWAWSGRIVEIAHSVDLEREQATTQDNFVSLKPLKSVQTPLEPFIYFPMLLDTQSYQQQDMLLQMEIDTNYNQRSRIIYGK